MPDQPEHFRSLGLTGRCWPRRFSTLMTHMRHRCRGDFAMHAAGDTRAGRDGLAKKRTAGFEKRVRDQCRIAASHRTVEKGQKRRFAAATIPEPARGRSLQSSDNPRSSVCARRSSTGRKNRRCKGGAALRTCSWSGKLLRSTWRTWTLTSSSIKIGGPRRGFSARLTQRPCRPSAYQSVDRVADTLSNCIR